MSDLKVVKPPFLHVLMPCSRQKNIPLLTEYLRGRVSSWIPLIDTELAFPNEKWITPFSAPLPRRENVCFWNVDNFVETCKIHDPDSLTADHFYHFMSDDCLWEWSYWAWVWQVIKKDPANTEVVVTTQRRPQGLIPACPENMLSFLMSFECLCLRGDVLAQYQLGRLWFADGMLAERLVADRRKVVYEQRAKLLYNALDPDYWGYQGHPFKEGDHVVRH